MKNGVTFLILDIFVVRCLISFIYRSLLRIYLQNYFRRHTTIPGLRLQGGLFFPFKNPMWTVPYSRGVWWAHLWHFLIICSMVPLYLLAKEELPLFRCMLSYVIGLYVGLHVLCILVSITKTRQAEVSLEVFDYGIRSMLPEYLLNIRIQS